MRYVLRATLVAFFLLAAPAFADSGLVGQWHFDEGRGTQARDSSGEHNDGALAGGPAWVSGRYGRALSFNGTTAMVDVPASSSLEPGAAVTVSAWVKGSSPGNFKYIAAKGATGCSAASYALYTGPAGGIMFYVSGNGGLTYTRSPDGGAAVWDGRWHFVAGTYDGHSVRLFVDGSEIGSGTPASGPLVYGLTNGNDLLIGSYGGCSGLGFSGTIDEPNVWARALSEAQIRTEMECPVYGDPVALCVVIRL